MPRNVVNGHLGGYFATDAECPHGDPQTYSTHTWDKLIALFQPKTMLDIGCGDGHAVNYFRSKGIEAYGVDGIPEAITNGICPYITLHDYRNGPYNPGKEFDLGWSCEFVEHVEEEYLNNFLATFTKCKILAMTHALVGQAGHHHVNCQEDAYWIEKLAGIGFALHEESAKLRQEGDGYYWNRSGLVFSRSCTK